MKPEFFKIIHANLFTTEQLRIPPDFLKHISKDKSGIAVIDGPNATYSWHVKFCRTEDGTYLTDGWKEFVRDHCLGEYDFLIFRYEGNMHFTVEIYDKTECQKHVGFSTQMHQELGSSGGVKRRGRPLKKLVEVPRRRVGRPPKDLHELSQKVRGSRLPGRRMPTEKEKAEVWKAAMTFTSSVPYFIRPLYGSSVYTSYIINIPADFARAYLPKHKAEFVIEDHLSGRFWTMNFNPGTLNSFTGGWPTFVLDNHLEAGDICIFELTASGNPLRSILAGLTELTMHINSFIIFMVYPAFVRPDRYISKPRNNFRKYQLHSVV
ncbi:B3 domain-containing protein [Thalictrum thalictroides]|uniref:B3 domain-containing protein n=1 Tax=Thalictrum thalictroides TaxID=46969 RepID=A0A7J6VJ65_THATH|nr:B3 domain-containing protein [Thalictrum thalictroides]